MTKITKEIAKEKGVELAELISEYDFFTSKEERTTLGTPIMSMPEIG